VINAEKEPTAETDLGMSKTKQQKDEVVDGYGCR